MVVGTHKRNRNSHIQSNCDRHKSMERRCSDESSMVGMRIRFDDDNDDDGDCNSVMSTVSLSAPSTPLSTQRKQDRKQRTPSSCPARTTHVLATRKAARRRSSSSSISTKRRSSANSKRRFAESLEALKFILADEVVVEENKTQDHDRTIDDETKRCSNRSSPIITMKKEEESLSPIPSTPKMKKTFLSKKGEDDSTIDDETKRSSNRRRSPISVMSSFGALVASDTPTITETVSPTPSTPKKLKKNRSSKNDLTKKTPKKESSSTKSPKTGDKKKPKAKNSPKTMKAKKSDKKSIKNVKMLQESEHTLPTVASEEGSLLSSLHVSRWSDHSSISASTKSSSAPQLSNHHVRRRNTKSEIRNSFKVPTRRISGDSLLHAGRENSLLLCDDLDTPSRGSIVTFASYSEMTIVADLSESAHQGDLYYRHEELAEFRHDAFLEDCGELLREDIDEFCY